VEGVDFLDFISVLLIVRLLIEVASELVELYRYIKNK